MEGLYLLEPGWGLWGDQRRQDLCVLFSMAEAVARGGWVGRVVVSQPGSEAIWRRTSPIQVSLASLEMLSQGLYWP